MESDLALFYNNNAYISVAQSDVKATLHKIFLDILKLTSANLVLLTMSIFLVMSSVTQDERGGRMGEWLGQ